MGAAAELAGDQVRARRGEWNRRDRQPDEAEKADPRRRQLPAPAADAAGRLAAADGAAASTTASGRRAGRSGRG